MEKTILIFSVEGYTEAQTKDFQEETQKKVGDGFVVLVVDKSVTHLQVIKPGPPVPGQL